LSSKVLVSFLLFASIRIATTLIEFYSSKYKNSAPLQGFVGRRKPSCMFSLSYCFGIGANMFSCILGQLASKNTQSPVVYHRLPWKEPFAPYLLDVLYEDNNMVAGMRTARYQAIPPKINRRRPIEGEIDRRRSIEGEKGKKKKKRKEEYLFPRAILAGAPSLPAGRQRLCAVAARRSQALFLPREEMDRLPARGERSRRRRLDLSPPCAYRPVPVPVAINKPSGLQVLPGGLFQQRTVLMQLQWKEWNKVSCDCSKRQMTHETHPVPVHRLGRGTSGLV
ncbi:hypothetical protein GW17_00047554, partial [Ensete ventricosum]